MIEAPTASQAMRTLGDFAPGVASAWRAIYGNAPLDERRSLALAALRGFIQRFGDRPARVFRAPGRVNLRGMHVDTHGGYLNLMTHQRETLAVAAINSDSRCTVANFDAEFPEIGFDPHDEAPPPGPAWGTYAMGAIRGARCASHESPIKGIDAFVVSDLPRGAALSSSHALCTALMSAALGWNELRPAPAAFILAVRDAEWFAGARTGTSDQGAMILGRAGCMVNVCLFPDDLAIDDARCIPFPDSLALLVINSYTKRQLGGADRARYTRNRVAYTLALDVFRHAMREAGMPEEKAAETDRLARVTPERLGGVRQLYALLRRVPEALSLGATLAHYPVAVDVAERARNLAADSGIAGGEPIPLRGPLLFGIAESERARHFGVALQRGDYATLGRWMNIGHDGDRVVDTQGAAFRVACGDAELQRWAEREQSVTECPGAYGASSPALDTLVDAARGAGALGACLTGAGIAGTVLALCRTEDTARIGDAVRQRLSAPDYAKLAKLGAPLEAKPIAEAVVVNCAPAGACELPLHA